jgi:hypothetical protein
LLRLDGAKRVFQSRGCPYDNRHFLSRDAALRSYSGLRNDIHEEWLREPILVAAATSENRFWFSSEPVRLSPSMDAYLVFLSRTKELGAPPFVVHDRPSMLAPALQNSAGDLQRLAQASAAVKVPVVLEEYRPDALALRFEAPKDGWLLVTDRWASGWNARVNDVPVTVDGGDFIFRGLPVRAGSNRIVLKYAPPGYPWLPVAVWLFIAGVLIASFWPFSRRGRPAERPLATTA